MQKEKNLKKGQKNCLAYLKNEMKNNKKDKGMEKIGYKSLENYVSEDNTENYVPKLKLTKHVKNKEFDLHFGEGQPEQISVGRQDEDDFLKDSLYKKKIMMKKYRKTARC